MALQYGMNITAADMRRLLEENDKQQSGIRSWRQLFGNASLGYEAQKSMLRQDYTNAMTEAYKNSFARRDALLGAGYNIGAAREMLGASRNDLLTAYDTYIRGYSESTAEAADAYTEEKTMLNSALAERAQNFAKVYQSVYNYLTEELYNSTTGDGTNYLTNTGLDWLYLKDSEGNLTTDIRPWEDLSTDLFDAYGALTQTGTQFFDQIFNAMPQGYMTTEGKLTRSFDKWLSDTDLDLRDWWVGQDYFNYNLAGTNRGTGLSHIDLESTRGLYNPKDYQGKKRKSSGF